MEFIRLKAPTTHPYGVHIPQLGRVSHPEDAFVQYDVLDIHEMRPPELRRVSHRRTGALIIIMM